MLHSKEFGVMAAFRLVLHSDHAVGTACPLAFGVPHAFVLLPLHALVAYCTCTTLMLRFLGTADLPRPETNCMTRAPQSVTRFKLRTVHLARYYRYLDHPASGILRPTPGLRAFQHAFWCSAFFDSRDSPSPSSSETPS